MRGKFASFGHQAVAAIALAAGAALVSATPVMAKDKEPAKPTVSPEFGAVAGPVQKAVSDFQDKKAKLSADDLKTQAAALVPQLAKIEGKVKAPLDQQVFGQWEYVVGSAAGDDALSTKGLNLMLSSGLMSADQNLQIASQLGTMAYRAKDYPAAIKALGPVVNNPATQDGVGEVLAASYESTDRPKDGLDALKTFVASHKAAGKPVGNEVYDFAVGIAYRAKLIPQTTEWSILRVAANPTPRNWFEAAQLVRSDSPNSTSQELLDISRLLDQTGALGLAPEVVGREYVIYLQSVDPRRYPGEAVRIADQGIASGALKAEDTFVKDALGQARPRLTADKASLPGLAKEAAAAPSGKVALAAADTFLSYGQADKADELYTMAMAKGGIDAEKDRALNRLGIAQIEEGKYADAKATLAKVSGVRASIAQLWSIYADQKAGAGK